MVARAAAGDAEAVVCGAAAVPESVVTGVCADATSAGSDSVAAGSADAGAGACATGGGSGWAAATGGLFEEEDPEPNIAGTTNHPTAATTATTLTTAGITQALPADGARSSAADTGAGLEVDVGAVGGAATLTPSLPFACERTARSAACCAA